MSHVLRFEDVIQLNFGEQIFLEHEFVNAAICNEGFLGYGGTLFVAEHRVLAEEALFRDGAKTRDVRFVQSR